MSKSVEDVVNTSVDTAKSKLNSLGFTVKVVGSGETVTSQMPKAGAKIYDGGVVVLYTNGEKSDKTEVPDFGGMTVAQVNSAAAEAGINVSFEGSSLENSGVTAYSQSEAAGEKVNLGSTVTVYFRDNSTVDFSQG